MEEPRTQTPTDIRELQDALKAAEEDARALVDGLTEEAGQARETPGSWSISECLDHLATGNRLYLDSMLEPAAKARKERRVRRGPARPGLIGGLFVAQLEPPPRWWSRMKAPRKIRPRESPPLQETFQSFLATQAGVRAFLAENADLDLAHISFPNPFITGIRFSLATGLHVIAAHERRHLAQAWRVRRGLSSS